MLSTDTLRDIVTKDGTYGIVFPEEMVARHDSVLVFGTGGLTDAKGNRLSRPGDNSSIVGFLLTNRRRTTTAIPAPRGLPTARYFRVRASEAGWDAVFFVPDTDTIPGTRLFDDGTLWYGRLRGVEWTEVERVGRVSASVVVRPNSSGLIRRDGVLRFAAFFGDPISPGGVLLWYRARSTGWKVDTLPLKWGPLTVTAPRDVPASKDARFFPVVGIWEGGEFFPGSLLSVDAAMPSEWKVIRRSRTQSMNAPVEHEVNGLLHVSWWEFENREPPVLWYQALDPTRENPSDGRRRVASGVNEFTFLAVPEGARTRLVWAYRPPSTMDSAEVAVVANGEPMVVGRVAFPFGFMTKGVASGDRSFILATLPRSVPDGEPSASRTLEVRVNCTGGT